jgi:hypothetical protein
MSTHSSRRFLIGFLTLNIYPCVNSIIVISGLDGNWSIAILRISRSTYPDESTYAISCLLYSIELLFDRRICYISPSKPLLGQIPIQEAFIRLVVVVSTMKDIRKASGVIPSLQDALNLIFILTLYGFSDVVQGCQRTESQTFSQRSMTPSSPSP